jgi:hypothetical protein
LLDRREQKQRSRRGPRAPDFRGGLLGLAREPLVHERRRAPQCAELDARPGVHARAQLFRRQVQLFRPEPNLARRVHLGVARCERLKRAREILLDAARLVHDEHGVAEVVERARVRAEQKRHEPLPARKSLALFGQPRAVFERARARLVRAPALARRLGPEAEVARADCQLAHRHDLRLAQGFDGELRLGVEPPERIHRVAEELDADGRVLARRPHVEDAAPHRELADRAHGVFAHVARSEQQLD